MDSTNTEWKITTKRYVAYIDIMGFKDMVARSRHADIYSIMKKIDVAKRKAENIQWGTSAEKLIQSTTYSDSILIYSKDISKSSLDSFICSVSAMTNDLFTHSIPHKGAISLGTMTLDNKRSIFFGQPLIDAYLLQEELYFYGIIVHGSAENTINKYANFHSKYLCPLKNGATTHTTIYPMHADYESFKIYNANHTKVTQSLQNMRTKTSGHLRKYIDNTETYFKHIFDQTNSKT